MNRSRFLATLALIGMVAASMLAHAQIDRASYVQTVQKASTQLTLTTTRNPSNLADGTAATLQVSGPGGTPSGNVTFSAVQAGSIATGQTAGTAALTLDGSGKAVWPLNLAPGVYTLVAIYAGDANFQPGQIEIQQTVIGPQDFTLELDPGSLIIKQGETWKGTLKATSVNGFQGVISMSCDGTNAAVFMTCLPGQAFSLTPAGPVHCPVQVTSSATILKIVGSTGIALFGLGLGVRRRRRYQMYSFALLSIVLLFTGCGGVRYEQRDGTPRGDYKVTFVGQSKDPSQPGQASNLSHAVSLVVTIK